VSEIKKHLLNLLGDILDFSKLFFISLATAFILKETVVACSLVPTGSMEETIVPGSRIVINRLAYTFNEPQRGDIVSFYYPDDGTTLYLKRIIGLPGEKVEGIDGVVYVDDIPLKENYIKEEMQGSFGPFTVPENSYFMMGDNRNNSWDSRYWDDKYVDISEIIGKAEIEYYPEIKVLE